MNLFQYMHNNKEFLQQANKCLCVYCLCEYNFNQIKDWCDYVDNLETTAICPKCGIDAIVASLTVTNLYKLEDVLDYNSKAF